MKISTVYLFKPLITSIHHTEHYLPCKLSYCILPNVYYQILLIRWLLFSLYIIDRQTEEVIVLATIYK